MRTSSPPRGAFQSARPLPLLGLICAPTWSPCPGPPGLPPGPLSPCGLLTQAVLATLHAGSFVAPCLSIGACVPRGPGPVCPTEPADGGCRVIPGLSPPLSGAGRHDPWDVPCSWRPRSCEEPAPPRARDTFPRSPGAREHRPPVTRPETGFQCVTRSVFLSKVPSPKRKLEEPVLEFRPPRGAITQPLKKLKINVFKVHKCAVCGFTTENLLQFHEHIPQHKSDGSSHQCRECGLCYTSHVSLSRHLFIVHKLKEPQPAAKQNGAGEESQQENKPGPEDAPADGPVSDRTCKVCAKTFETEAALNAHMRTHGMAFIKSKRVSSAEK